ncbi:MAG: hypothetical protein ACKVP7_11780 [Hyphomicrobiaceae bacterium]
MQRASLNFLRYLAIAWVLVVALSFLIKPQHGSSEMPNSFKHSLSATSPRCVEPDATFAKNVQQLFLWQEGGVATKLALAERAGIADWARDQLLNNSKAGTELKLLSWQSPAAPSAVLEQWEVLRSGDATTIFQSIDKFTLRNLKSARQLALGELLVPLFVLARDDVLHELALQHTESDSSFYEPLALALMQIGEWEKALVVLESVHKDKSPSGGNMWANSMYWKQAERQRVDEHTLRRLASIPLLRFQSDAARASDLWPLLLLSGREVLDLTPAAASAQPAWSKAAAIKVAMLERAGRREEADRWLAALDKPPTEMILVEKGMQISFSASAIDLAKARTHVAARERDIEALERLAALPSSNLLLQHDVMAIDAAIDEGDWIGAARLLKKFDPRQRTVPRGFDDDRSQVFASTHAILAALASSSGDDVNAAHHLATMAAEICQPGAPAEAINSVNFLATILAGAAEGKLPHRLVGVLWPTFRAAY